MECRYGFQNMLLFFRQKSKFVFVLGFLVEQTFVTCMLIFVWCIFHVFHHLDKAFGPTPKFSLHKDKYVHINVDFQFLTYNSTWTFFLLDHINHIQNIIVKRHGITMESFIFISLASRILFVPLAHLKIKCNWAWIPQ